MKIITTHTSPDIDAITSVWIIKRFFPGWDEASVEYVPAGSKYKNRLPKVSTDFSEAIEDYDGDEVIHVDTGLGPLDHHQTSDDNVCGASRSLDFVKSYKVDVLKDEKLQAIERIVRVVVDYDHFKEVFRADPLADYQDFSLVNVLDGLKLMKPDQDNYYTERIMEALDALLHEFENRVWAEKEIKENSTEFESQWGKALGLESVNDSVIKIAQKMGFVVVLRRDPRKGYIRIKASPRSDVDLTNTYEKLKKMDPEATWFLHVSKKMLLNGTPKNPKMKPTSLSLGDIISVLKNG